MQMGRPKKQTSEPFWRDARNCWYVQIGKKQIKLYPDRDEASGSITSAVSAR
jgi:hypothetical protein